MTRPHAAWIAATLLLLLFALDAALVASGVADGFDRAVLHALRRTDLPGVAISPEWTVALARDITALGSDDVRLPVTLAAIAWLLWRKRRHDAAIFFAAVASGAAALPLLKLLFHRARPELPWRLVVEHDLSFPSGHAMGSMLLYALLGTLLAGRLGAILGISTAIAVGLTRIFLGVHWTSDVLGGWAIGGAWACAAVASGRAHPSH